MLEMSPEKKPLAIAHALFYKGLKAVKGDESRIHVVNGKIQIRSCRRRMDYQAGSYCRNLYRVQRGPFLRPLFTQADE